MYIYIYVCVCVCVCVFVCVCVDRQIYFRSCKFPTKSNYLFFIFGNDVGLNLDLMQT